MKKILNDKLVNILVKIMSIVLFGIVFISLIFVDTNIKYTYSNDIKLRNYIYLGIIAIIILIAGIFKLLFKKQKIKDTKVFKFISKNLNIIIGIMFVLLFLAQVVIEKNIYFETSWDAEHIINTAINFAKNGVFENNNYYDVYPYFSVYPNNLFLAAIFSVIGKVVANFNIEKLYEVLILIDIILVDLSGIIMLKTIKNITESKLVKLVSAILFITLIGFSPWFMVPYSDTYAILFPITVLYNYTVKEKKWYNYLMIGLFSYAGYLIKPTAIIVLIAIAIIEIYKALFKIKDMNKNKVKEYSKNLLCLVLGIVIVFGINVGLKKAINYKVEKDYSFSLWHYFMMGLSQDTTGCFNSGDVTNSLGMDTYEHRVENNKKVFKERIKELSESKKMGSFYLKKLLVNYNDGTFAWGREGWFYKTLKENDSKLSKALKSFYYNEGSHFDMFTSIMQTIWLGMIIFITITAIFGKFENKKSVIFLSIIGLTLFTLIFEGRARYLYLYSPYYIILAAMGVEVLNKAKIGKFKH